MLLKIGEKVSIILAKNRAMDGGEKKLDFSMRYEVFDSASHRVILDARGGAFLRGRH